MNKKTVIGLVLFLLGGGTLGGVAYLRSLLAEVEVSSVELRPQFSLTSPGIACTIRGLNPLPLSVVVHKYRVQVGADELPVALLLSSDKAVTATPGEFEIETQLAGKGRSVGVLLGGGVSLKVLRGLGYRGSMVVGVGPLKRVVPLKGVISWFK